MLSGLINYFYPDLKKEEVLKFSLLALAFFLTIGAYWMLRLLKDTIFFKIAFPVELGWPASQGKDWQPYAKMVSVSVVLVAVLIYSVLVDLFKKERLFGIICGFFGTLFAIMTGIMVVRELYGPEVLGWQVLAIFGWASYLTIESFGSIVVALFWSFTASTTTTEQAKRGYPFIVSAAQIGAIGGSALNILAPSFGYSSPVFVIATLFIFAVPMVITSLVKTVPAELMTGNPVAKEKEGKKKENPFFRAIKGLILIISRPYLFGILLISTLYEVVGTIVDFQMKTQANGVYSSRQGMQMFLGWFGVASNSLAFLMALLGTRQLIKQFGLRVCLLLYPVALGIAMTALYFFSTTGPNPQNLLWATFAVMMIAKGLSYAVSNPTKEMMYIPTSKDAKFKAKGFTDMFGGGFAKAGGSAINNMFKHDLALLMLNGTLIGLGMIGIWVLAAIYVGIYNAKLIKEDRIVD